MTLLEQIVDVMADQRGPAHVSDIAAMLVERYPNISTPLERLPDRVSAVLAADVRKTGGKAKFAKVKSKGNHFKRGVYRLKTRPVVTPKPTEAPSVSTQFTGRAGESAVISELLFYGFNAAAMAVDDGIDIVASKENNYFHIQVKTANRSDQGGYAFSIKRSSFGAKDSYQMFYVFLMRERDEHRYFNDYLILPSSQVRQLIEAGIVKDGPSYALRVQKDSRGRYMLNAKQDVTISINTFSQLA